MLKLALALMFQSFDLPFLRLHLPVYLDSGAFDGLVALSGDVGWTQEADALLLGRYDAYLTFRPFDHHFGKQRNTLVQTAEDAGYDALVMVDCDELMFGGDLREVRALLETGTHELLGFPRFNFVGDRLHHYPGWLPDVQWRAWRLKNGVRYDEDSKVHELPIPVAGRRVVEEAWIYHYGYIKSADERNYRTALYDALRQGKSLPRREDYVNQTLPLERVPFAGAQPLDPAIVGIRAPFEGENA